MSVPLEPLTIILLLITAVPAILLFVERKLLHSVVMLAMSATGSALIFLYLGQTLLALLQLLVFVGGLSTYLIVAIAAEEKQPKLTSMTRLLTAAAIIVAVLLLLVDNLPSAQPGSNNFTSAAESAFSDYFAFLFVSVFLLFASAIGSVLVIKKFAKLLV